MATIPIGFGGTSDPCESFLATSVPPRNTKSQIGAWPRGLGNPDPFSLGGVKCRCISSEMCQIIFSYEGNFLAQ